MVVVPLTQPETERALRIEPRNSSSEGTNWVRAAAGGGLLLGGLLLLTGNKRAGLVAAGGGTALALLDQKETVLDLWDALPGYIDQAQHLLGKVERTVAELGAQSERLHKIITS
jgi:hypothetical protein